MVFDIIIADDHSLVLEGLRKVILNIPGLNTITTVRNGSELLDQLSTRHYNIYIIDLEMPDMDGFELIKHIKEKDSEAKIIVSTMHEEIWIVNKLKSPDIQAVVFKSSASTHIQEAIETVLKGNSYYCPRYLKLYKGRDKTANIVDTLETTPTPRELDILKDIAKGMSTHEISEHLFISENTVEWHRKNLMLKFGAKNSIDLVIKALAKGFLSIPL